MKQKIAFIVSAPVTARVFLAHQINELSKRYDVTVIANLDQADNTLDNISAKVHIRSLPIERDISYIADLKALVLLTRLFLRERFILTHSVTPKAGLIANLAGYLSRVPNRLHTFTGQVWLTQNGFKRWLLKSMDKWIVMLATQVLADSASQRDFLIKHEIVKEDSIVVLEEGSISGVDLLRFHPSSHVRKSIRHTLNLDPSAKVLLFLGRMKVDKGVLDLAQAFAEIYRKYPGIALLYIGPDEENLTPEIINICGEAKSALRFIEYNNRPEDYMASADILVLPSYREGFGNVGIEAAACEVPAVVSNIYGLTDAVEDGETGLLFEVGNTDQLVYSIGKLIKDDNLRTRLGGNARKRAGERFSQERVTNALCVLYNQLLNSRDLNIK
jgi:glycosyltransferase involved in cell wall biosynthesis